MKKTWVFILIVFSFLLTSCFKSSLKVYDYDRVVETEFVNYSSDYEIENKVVDLHFFARSYLPYIDLMDFINMLDGYYYAEDFEVIRNVNEGLLYLNYYYYSDLYSITFDANEDLIFVPDLDYFYGNTYESNTVTNIKEVIRQVGYSTVRGEAITYNLKDYDFKLVLDEEKLLIPLSIVSLIFLQHDYFKVYYNGDYICSIDSMDMDYEEYMLIVNSSFNNKKLSKEMRVHSYNYFCFVIDYFYGLKEDKEIESGKSFIDKEDFLKGNLYKKINDNINKLNDLHTSYFIHGFYERGIFHNDYFIFEEKSINQENWEKAYKEINKELKEKYNKNVHDFEEVSYEYINDKETLIIYITSFTFDTYDLVKEVLEEVTRETKNIVLDVSMNTGGLVYGMYSVLSLTTYKIIDSYSINPLTNAKEHYRFKNDDKVFNRQKYFIKTSELSYSAANSFASLGKTINIPIIGKKTAGGAASVGVVVFPDGSIVGISRNDVHSNNLYESIESGVEPDYYLNKLYDDEELLRIINEHLNKN